MSASNQSFFDRHYFLLRRLHSLTGVFPIGVFLFPHLTTNSSIVWGEALNKTRYAELTDLGPGAAGVATFQHEVEFIHNLPALILIEIFVLFIPIAFHSLLGIYFARTGRSNTARYAYQSNWRYTWQRLTGYVGVVFIFMHVTSLRFGWSYGGLMPSFSGDAASSSTAIHMQEGTLGLAMAALYLVAVLALVFHFANGLWTAAITWGITVSSGAQRRWGYVCAGLGLALAGAGVAAVFGFATLDIERAQEVEAVLRGMEPAAPVDPSLAGG